MAGEAEAGKENLTDSQALASEELKGPEDEGSLASIMEQTPRPVFTGHPALGEAEGEAGPEGGDEGGKPPEPPEPPKPPEKKYKSWEEAEAGAREHQSAFTKKAEEAAREKEAREAAERERDEIKQKLTAKPPETPAEETRTPEELEAEQEARIEGALDEIGQLDEFDPEYKKKVARSWRKAGIGGAGQPTTPSGQVLDELINKRVEERFKARETEKEAENQESRIRTRAGEMAGKAGLNMEEGSADHTLFWATVSKMPQDLDAKPFEEQVQWTANEVRRLKGEVVQSKAEMDAKAREIQVNNTVLERGSTRPKKKEVPEPYTLGSIMTKHQESRRI
ncbi:MAG: hypothetical protein QME78_00035 [Thermodesulfobacteriota bacterium]|nr:hypothetical protein [Thermodesulfobacteriota bacterium]